MEAAGCKSMLLQPLITADGGRFHQVDGSHRFVTDGVQIPFTDLRRGKNYHGMKVRQRGNKAMRQRGNKTARRGRYFLFGLLPLCLVAFFLTPGSPPPVPSGSSTPPVRW